MNHGDNVTVYDRNGNLECRGKIVGITHSNPAYYDVAPLREFSMSARVCGVPAARVRKVGLPELVKTREHVEITGETK